MLINLTAMMSQQNDYTHVGRVFWNVPAGSRASDMALACPIPGHSQPLPQNQLVYPVSDLQTESQFGIPHAYVRRTGNPSSRHVPCIPEPMGTRQSQGAEQEIWNSTPSYQDNDVNRLTTNDQEDGGDAPSNSQFRRPKGCQPSEDQWNQNKQHIERLYMKEKLSLQEVTKRMAREYNFFASERMYKNRFKIWQWSKYCKLPPETVLWITEKAQERMPRKTTFYWNNQELSEEKLRQKCGKAYPNLVDRDRLIVCAPTPTEISYNTPPTIAPSPRLTKSAAAEPYIADDQGNKKPTFYLDNAPINIDLSQTTISELRTLLLQASQSASVGNTNDASADFRDAVSGFSFLLSPTDEQTLRAAYLYASFYANSASMNEANAVLNWMSEKHIEKWGPGHEKTYRHYARTIELFRCWGRREHAELLVHRVLDGTQQVSGDALVNSTQNSPGTQAQHSAAAVNVEPGTDAEAISAQFDKIDLGIMSSITGPEDVLGTVIQCCEDKPDDLNMAAQACKAKCQLARLHISAGRDEEMHQALKTARKSLDPLLRVVREPMSHTTFQLARGLAGLYFEVKDQPSCNSVLDQLIVSLMARRSIPSYERKAEDDAFILDFILCVAFEFHEASTWAVCRYWVERGLGLAIRMHGRNSPEAQRFQKILNQRNFNMRTSKSIDEIMKCSGGLFGAGLDPNLGY